MRLRNQLILSFAFVTIITALAGGLITSSAIHSDFQTYIDQYQKNRVNQWQMIFTNYYTRFQTWDGAQQLIFNKMGAGPGMGKQGRGMAFASLSENERIIVENSSGIVAVDSKASSLGEIYQGRISSGTLTKDIIVNGQRVGRMLAEAEPPSTFKTLEDAFLSSVNRSVLLSGLFVVILAVFLAAFFSANLSRPLKKLTIAAEKISSGDFSQNVEVQSENEIGHLGAAFNKMAINLQQNEHLRQSLVADVAHELRTPISILRGNLESILAGVTEPKEENLALIHDEVLRMSFLVRDLQELSLAEAGQLKLNKQKVDVLELAKKIINFFQVETEEKGIHILSETNNEIPLLNADPQRLEQIFANLLSNAIRYSSANEDIAIRFAVSEQSLVIQFVDSGPGIETEELPYIFERFYRGDKARSRVSGGTGLGLAISKGYAEMHGGTIKADNNAVKGSTFTVELPLG